MTTIQTNPAIHNHTHHVAHSHHHDHKKPESAPTHLYPDSLKRNTTTDQRCTYSCLSNISDKHEYDDHSMCDHLHTSPLEEQKHKPFIDVVSEHVVVRYLQVFTSLLMIPMIPMMVYAIAHTGADAIPRQSAVTLT